MSLANRIPTAAFSLVWRARWALTPWTPFDPSDLVALAREQEPDELWLPEALIRCDRGKRESPAYVGFVPSARPSRPGSAWQFERNIVLSHPQHGDVVIDVLEGHRIGGLEYLSRL